MNILLLVLLFFFLLLNIYVLKRDLLSPTSVYILGYIIASFFVLLNANYWGFEIELLTILMIIISIISFILAENIAIVVARQKKNNIEKKYIYKKSIINISIVCIISIIASLLIVLEVYRISRLGVISGNGIVYDYRINTLYNGAKMSEVVSTVIKTLQFINYFMIFLIIQDILDNSNKIKVKHLFMGIPTLLYTISLLFMGGRLHLITIVFFVIVIYYILAQKRKMNHRASNIKRMFYLSLIFAAFVFVFFSLREIVGRSTFDENIFQYFGKYIGASIHNLDYYLENINQKDLLNFTEVFPGIIISLNKIGLNLGDVDKALPFVISSTGVGMGNVYTGLRRYYSALGFFGVLIFPFILSFLFSYLYYSIKKINVYSENGVYILIIFAYLYSSVLINASEDQIFIKLSIGLIIEFLILYIIVKIFPHKRI